MILTITIENIKELLERGELSEKMRAAFNQIANHIEDKFVGYALEGEFTDEGEVISRFWMDEEDDIGDEWEDENE